jgi:hypothetical protein
MQGSRRTFPRQEGLSSGLLTLIPPDARYPPRERRLMPEWDIRLAGGTCLRLAVRLFLGVATRHHTRNPALVNLQ